MMTADRGYMTRIMRVRRLRPDQRIALALELERRGARIAAEGKRLSGILATEKLPDPTP